VQDNVLIESQVSGDFDGERDAHRRHGRHDVDVVGPQHVGEFFAGFGHERDAHVHRDQEREGQILVQRDDRELYVL